MSEDQKPGVEIVQEHKPKYPVIPDYDESINFANLAEAISTYVATRDDLAEERKHFNTYEARAKNYMDRIEMFIKEKADDMGVDSVRTSAGTAYRTVKTSYRVGDWNAYWEWIRANNYSQCIEKRAAKLAVKEIHDETGEVPPGLEYHVEVGFDVRRPSK